MDSNFIVSLIPTNFEAVVKDYVKHWDDHIDWVRQTLDQIKLDADNASTKTPQTKIKSTVKKKKSTTRSSQSVSRPSANILNNVMADKSARITRSTSRFLKQHKLINEDGNLIKVDEKKVLKVFDENAINSKKTKEINEKKVSFEPFNLNEKDEHKKIDNKLEINKQNNDESIDKENKTNNIKDNINDKNLIKEIDHNNENSKSIDKQVNNEEKSKEMVNKKIEQLQQQDQQMECSPIKTKTPNILIDSNLITPNNKTLPKQIDEDEWITDDDSIEQKPNKSIIKSKNENDKNKEKSNLLPPSARVGIKRSATLKSATKPPLLETKRNKTNEFATPQSLKKFYRPFQFGSAGKKITRIPTVNPVSKSAITNNKVTSNFNSKSNKPDDHHLDVASHTNNQHQATNNRFLVPPTSSASSSICSNSQGSLKSGLTGQQQTNGKTFAQNSSTNSSENKKTICFGESALKQRLKEEERRKLLESKIEKENEAKLKKDKLLQQRALQAKIKREERERKIKESKLLHDVEDQKRNAEQKKLEELKKQFEIKQKAEEAERRLAEIKKMEEARKRAQEEAREELKRKKEEEELKRKKEEEEELKRKKEEEESRKEQQRLKELQLKENQKTLTKKVQIKIDSDQEINDDLQTKLFNKIEKEIKRDEMKCKNTPLKQLVEKAVGKTNAEKSLYKPEIDPSLDLVNISLDLTNCEYSSDEEPQNITTNNTFIKGINNKATLSSTFIKPTTNVNNFNKTIVFDKKEEEGDKKQLLKEQPIEEQPIEEESLVLDTYDISDLRSSDDEDDEEQQMFKRIPDWAKGNNFLRAVKDQFNCGIRERENRIKNLFSSIESNVQLQDVFKGSERFVHKKYERRTSSACWSSPPATYIDSSFSKFY